MVRPSPMKFLFGPPPPTAPDIGQTLFRWEGGGGVHEIDNTFNNIKCNPIELYNMEDYILKFHHRINAIVISYVKKKQFIEQFLLEFQCPLATEDDLQFKNCHKRICS